MKNIKKIRVSGSDIFVFKKKTILMSLCLIFVLLEFGSCSQLFNTPSSGNNSSGTTGYTGCIFKISVTTPDGCVSSDILGTTGTKSAVSRSVFPVIPTNYKAKIWTTGSTVPDTWISPESGTNLTFNFGSVAAAAYTVRLGFFTDSSDAAPSFYADGTVTVTKGQTSADCTVSILPDNCTAGDGTTTTGSISLELTDEATEIKSFSASLVNSSSTTLLTVTQKTGASDSSTYAIIGTGFPEGTYTLKIYGLDSSGNIIYRYPSDVLYVWPGLTTNTWYLNDDTKPASLDITEDMYKTALATTIYVSENGSDTGDGGYYKPFKTVQHAVNCCTDTAINGTDGTGYTIYIDGKITLSSNSDDTDTIMIDNSKKITFAGLKGASTDIIDGGKAYQILTVSSGSTVTIVDLMLQNGYTSGNGGCISNAGTLTINGSTLTGCTAVNGGGVYNSGTLTMTGGTITGNTASSGGSGVYNSGTFNISGSAVVDANSNDVYLADGCVITVTGNLSETTVAEITMQYPVPGAEVLAFSGVSGSENICGQFTYENDNTDGTTDPDGSTTINENDGRNYALHYGSSSGILTCDRFYVEGNNSTELTESGTGTQTQSDTTGSPDYADGSKQKPFAGVQKAASLISTFPSAADPTGGYTIYIDGTVSLSSTINISTKKKLTLEGMSGSGTDILNGGHTSGGTDGCQILNIALGSTVTMENLTLKNGYSSGNGGCVYNAGTLTISSSNIKNCTAKYSGGGVYNKGTFNMYNSTIKSCSANPGGGVYNYSGKFNMYSGTIGGTTDADGNKASSYGGGVFNYLGGTFNFSGGTISHNTADGNAGGIDNNGGTVNITGITCTISGNISKGTGGGINNYSEKTTDYPGKIIMSAGTISGNTAATSGGGVNMESGKFNMSGGTIGGTDADDINKASDGSGGGVNIQAGEDVGTDKTATLTMSGGTIIGNTATYGGGVNICSGGTFKMSGSAVVASNNDVYLTTGKYITIAGTLSPVSNTTDSSSLSAVITTPETASSYTTGTQVLTLLTSGSWDECNYFGLSR
ncbi:MAG: hypothetical protein M0P01_13345, partial [Treponema sp.]|nr:hypothetical protein [Treponema sp.]